MQDIVVLTQNLRNFGPKTLKIGHFGPKMAIASVTFAKIFSAYRARLGMPGYTILSRE